MKKSKLKLICLTVFTALSFGCAGTPPLPVMHVLDTQAKGMREYELIDKEKIIFQFKANHPMRWGKNTYGNGFFCAPPQEVALWLEYFRKNPLPKY